MDNFKILEPSNNSEEQANLIGAEAAKQPERRIIRGPQYVESLQREG